jgi:hypothetical protein
MSTLTTALIRLYALAGTVAFFLFDTGTLFPGADIPEQTWLALMSAPLLLVVLLAHSVGFYDELLNGPKALPPESR